jgi:hypothetical protein
MNEARDRRARLNEWVVHEQYSRRRKEQAERERAKTEPAKGCKQGEGQGPMQSQGKEEKRKKRNGVHAKGMDAHAYAKLRMQDLPAVVLQASRLLGCDGEYVVFPRTRNKFLCKINRVIDSFRIGKVLETGAVVTGSFLLHHLMQGAKWLPNDLDLFGTPAALRVARRLFWGPDVDVSLVEVTRDVDIDTRLQELKSLPGFMNQCPWVSEAHLRAGSTRDAEPDKVVSYTEWMTLAGFRVKFFCVGGSTVDDVRDTITQFDLALCRAFFDGRFIYVPKETHAALQVRRAPMTDNEDNVTLERAEDLLQCASKYTDRGFQVDLPTTLGIFTRPSGWARISLVHNKSNHLIAQQYTLRAQDRNTWWVHLAERQKRFDEEMIAADRSNATHAEVCAIMVRHRDVVRVSLRTAGDE